MDIKSISRIWWVSTAAFSLLVSLCILMLASRNYWRLHSAVMDSQKKMIQFTIESDYTSLVDDTYLHLNTLVLREQRYQKILGSNGEIKLRIVKQPGVTPTKANGDHKSFDWQKKNGSTEQFDLQLWFGNIYLGLLEAEISWDKDLFFSHELGKNWQDSIVIILLILGLWTIIFYLLNKRVILPLIRKSNELIQHAAIATLNAQVANSLNNLAQQVSHDIRSPLSALNMVLGTLQGLPEEKRLLIRGATQRINDIANGLLQKSKSTPASPSSLSDGGPIILVPLIDSILSEKRTQFRDRMEIEIVEELNRGYGLFSKISGSELARVISNLINNSVEAFVGPGKVVVAIAEKDELIEISIKDNGKGIPPHVLARLGERGVTHGKEGTQSGSGSGLGVHHARETIENAGGKFLLESTVGAGTSITLALPKCEPPRWFRESLAIKQNSIVVSVDDDQTIHQIWAGRLSSAGFDSSLNHKMFSSLDAFEDWVQADKPSNTICLIDYEFLGQNGNGLDSIRKLGIEKHAVLITSRFEEPHVRRTAESLSVKIIPKSLAPFVPIKIEQPREKYHAVLIDDDPLVVMTWQMAAQENGKKIICFSSEETFFDSYESIDPSSPLFVDVSLAKGVRGEDVAAKASKAGFTNIRLATGYDAASVSLPVGVIETVGKDPIFF